MFLTEGVSDPTDFSQPTLRELDGILRCPICKEFFAAPVSLRCGHSFCSLCIRDSLTTKSECPACRSQASEGHLVKNVVLEEAIAKYVAARPEIIAATKPKKRKRTPSRDDAVPTPKRRNVSSGSGDINNTPCNPKGKGKGKAVDENENESGVEFLGGSNSNFVECPVCSQLLEAEEINRHLDRNCQDIPKTDAKTSWNGFFAKGGTSSKGKATKPVEETRKPMPSVAYNLWKQKQFRDAFKELGLDATGDPPALEARHRRWSTLWNANLDSSKPKATEELKQELRQWEKDKAKAKARKNATSDSATDDKAWQATHGDQFKALIAAARAKPVPKSNCSTPSTSSDSPSLSLSAMRPQDVIDVDI